jgi:peptidoglycan/xylan/chitin deacetylase (PgdA/CDA1 family)
MSKDCNSFEIAKRKKARGAVLGLLDDNYPRTISYIVMERLMADTGTAQAHELEGIVRYLQDKGYISVTVPEEPELKPLRNGIIELRAHGIDLLEGSIPEDPGVDF